jgi:hypothetical protein
MKRFAFCVVCLLCAAVVAQDKKPADKQPSQEEMMAAMAKYGAVTENHKKLEALAGDWKADVKMWMGPGEPEKSQGSSKNEMIMGGRFLKSEFSGNMMGRPFKGCSLNGYDNAKGKFIGLWIDDMSTGYMASEGSCDASGKVLTLTSEFECPIRKQHVKMRMVTTLIDSDSHKLEMFDAMPDGKEMKTMEILYTRAK